MSALMTIALMLKAYDNMSGVVQGASTKSITAIGKVQEKMRALSDQSEKFGRTSIANGLIVGASIMKPLQAFADLEDATTSLKIAMMDNMGQIPAQFDAIKKQAIDLGNILPGTTADFIGVARALQEQGTGMDTVLNGGLKAASYLSVLLKMPGAEAGEMVAKLREAYGLADNELEKMADLVQRARYAFGMTPQDIKIAASYSGATQNILGLKGMENAKQLMALQGLGAGVSLEGSSWGTNFAQMLNRMADSKDRLMKNSKEMKALNADLKGAGINLEFFNDKGQFSGLQNMVQQLEKLNKLSDVDKLNALKKLFGVEAARPAAIIAQQGMAGFEAAIKKMDQQASLQQRIELSLGTMRNTWDALTGTATNALAMIGEPLAHLIYPYIVKLNELVGGPIMSWIDQHQRLVGIVGFSIVLFSLLAIGLGVLGFAVSGLSSGVAAMLGVWRGGLMVWGLVRAGIAAVRGQIMGLMVVQRAQMALQALQNAIAYRGGVWQALQYALMTTRYRMLEGVAAMRAWIAASMLWVRANLLSVAGLRALAMSFGASLVNGIRAAAVAVRAFSLALLANPITWVVAAIAGAAILIYKYWRPISGFFRGVWQGIREGLGPLLPSFQRFAAFAARVFSPIIGPAMALWSWLKRIAVQVDDTGGAAQKLGVRVGQGIAKAIAFVMRLGATVLQLPAKFYDAGVQMMQGLWNGIQARAGAVMDAIGNMASGIANRFRGALGIHSPSRVFQGFGANITQGAALGIQGGMPQIQRASQVMATATLTGAKQATSVYGAVPMPRQAGSFGGGGGMVVHFSPTIQVQGGGDVRGQIDAAMNDAYREFENNMRRWEREQQRRAF